MILLLLFFNKMFYKTNDFSPIPAFDSASTVLGSGRRSAGTLTVYDQNKLLVSSV